VIRGQTVDISESDISIMQRDEVTIGEVVRLEIALPFGDVEGHAFSPPAQCISARFQFLESGSAQDVIERTCRHLPSKKAIVSDSR